MSRGRIKQGGTKAMADKGIWDRQILTLLGEKWDGCHIGQIVMVDFIEQTLKECGLFKTEVDAVDANGKPVKIPFNPSWPHPLVYHLNKTPKWRSKNPLTHEQERNVWWVTQWCWDAFVNAAVKHDGTFLRQCADAIEAKKHPIDPTRNAIYNYVADQIRKQQSPGNGANLPTRSEVRRILEAPPYSIKVTGADSQRQFNTYMRELEEVGCVFDVGKAGRPKKVR